MNRLYNFWALIFGRPFFSKFNRRMFLFSLRGMGVLNYSNNSVSGEKWLIENVVRKMGKDLVVFDVGANIGDYSKSLIKGGISVKQIFAFEPHPYTFELLKSNTSNLGVVTPIQAALSNLQGEMILYDREDKEGSAHASLSLSVFSQIYRIESTQRKVRVDTLDIFCANNGIQTIDFLKIDVEGYELNVLRGAQEALSKNRIRLIQFEFTQLNAAVGVFFKELYDLLSGDYYIYRMLPRGLQKIEAYDPITCEIFAYQNFAAIRKVEQS